MRFRWKSQDSLVHFVFILSSLSYLVHADCFHPNGTRTTDPLHRPCSNDPSNPLSSICCALARPIPAGGFGLTSDSCLLNGVCMNQKQITENGTDLHVEYFREECTTKDWKSGKCPIFCLVNRDRDGGNAGMTPCDGTPTSEKWCCGAFDTSCCTVDPIIIPAMFQTGTQPSLRATMYPAPSSARPTSRTSTRISTLSSSSLTTATKQASSSGSSASLSGGAIAGVVLGSVLIVVLAMLAGFLVVRRRRAIPLTAPPMEFKPAAPWHENKVLEVHRAEAMDSEIVEAPITNMRDCEGRGKVQELYGD